MNSFSTISSILSRRKGIDTWLLMMLLACSTNLNAQSDPFGTVDVHKYSENMTLFGQVLLNGTPLGSETVIAAFHGDELRGKGLGARFVKDLISRVSRFEPEQVIVLS